MNVYKNQGEVSAELGNKIKQNKGTAQAKKSIRRGPTQKNLQPKKREKDRRTTHQTFELQSPLLVLVRFRLSLRGFRILAIASTIRAFIGAESASRKQKKNERIERNAPSAAHPSTCTARMRRGWPVLEVGWLAWHGIGGGEWRTGIGKK
jgi:hypothetical protein